MKYQAPPNVTDLEQTLDRLITALLALRSGHAQQKLINAQYQALPYVIDLKQPLEQLTTPLLALKLAQLKH